MTAMMPLQHDGPRLRVAPKPMMAPQLPPQRKRRSWGLFLLGLFGFLFGAVTFLSLIGLGVAYYIYLEAAKDLPDYQVLAAYKPPVMTRIHAHDGSLIAEYAHERRIYVPYNAIPKLVVHAFLSAEDKRFFDHSGIDYWGVARALYKATETYLSGSGRRAEGASTITQQVAKNFLLTNERSMDRKIKEAILAFRIEETYSKEKILELYLNKIFFGLDSYGIAAASLNYFNKELRDLTIEEVAYLAALPKGPNNYHPFKHNKKATERRDWIIGQMEANGYITAEEAAAAKAKPLNVNIRPFGAHIFAAEYFAEDVRRWLQSSPEFGEKELYEGGLSVRTTLDPGLQQIARQALVNGLVNFDRAKGWRGPVKKIDVSADWGAKLQEIDTPGDIQPWRLGVVIEADKAKAVIGLKPLRKQDNTLSAEREAVELALAEVKWALKPPLKKGDPRGVSDALSVGDVVYVAPKDPANLAGVWSLMQIPEVGGGVLVMDPHTGRILAVVGGFSFSMSQFDRAIMAKRQPGSVFKPIVYAAALDNGYKPTSLVLDAPIQIDAGPGKEIWDPKNYGDDNKSYGPTTLRQGVERSRNKMTVRLAQDMGMPLITEYARRFGIYKDLLPVLSMSLGAGETTLLKMTTAYAMFANGGKFVRATLIDRIQDRWGKTVWKHDNRACSACAAESWTGQDEPEIPDDRRQVIDPYTSYQMTSILEGVIQRGTATKLKTLGRPLAGKTGTSNEEKDAWFVGYSPDLVVGVYIGYDTPRPMGKNQTGGEVAAPIFGEVMKTALADKPPTPFRIPEGMQVIKINATTGLRAEPGETSTIEEAFKPSEEPDDAYSVIGFSSVPDENGTSEPPAEGRSEVGNDRGGLW